MNRNTNLHFSQTPKINIARSKFDESCSIKTTFNVGDVVPVYVDSDILPGDTVQMDMTELIRMATPIYPIMDNLFADIYWFFVPHRLVMTHWPEFWGENNDPWIQTQEYEIPQITAPSGGWTEGSIADYMGIPTKVDGFKVNALPFRAYAKIWNDWFRDENLKSCCHIYEDETTRTGTNGSTYVTDVELGGMPAKAAKFHDMFTSALPSPQKGNPVTIGLTGQALVTTAKEPLIEPGDTLNRLYYGQVKNNKYMYNSKTYTGAETSTGLMSIVWPQANTTQYPNDTPVLGSTIYSPTGLNTDPAMSEQTFNSWAPLNLYADMGTATAITVNELRTAFAIQKYFENAGLHGTRYIEYIRSVFGVTSSDARFQRAEYLGGQRVPINIDQIIQTSSTDATSPQGNTAGFSCTINKDSMFTKSFEEHGTLMCMMVVRCEHSYQQGLDRMWSRKKWSDFFNPFFSHLSEQALLNKQLYLQSDSVVDTDGNVVNDQAFGYQEAWVEYRYKPNRVTGYMRSNATGSLDVWHFADDYNALPKLGSTWIDEPKDNVDRTIAVTSQITHQFIADLYFKAYYTRPMPVYSVPGLIDHV